MKDLPDFEQRIVLFEVRLKPIANRLMDFNSPDFQAQLAETPQPLDKAGIRAEMEMLLTEITDYYAQTEPSTRAAIRALFEKNRAAVWAAAPPWPPTTKVGFRRQVLLFSILDQGQDSRDAILWLQDICARARVAGLDIKPVLEEIAGFSSEINKYGMGSTKDLLLKFC